MNLLRHFPALEKRLQIKSSEFLVASAYANQLNKILDKFKRRFADFTYVLPAITFLSNPFCNSDVTDTESHLGSIFKLNVSDLEMEIISLQTDVGYN